MIIDFREESLVDQLYFVGDDAAGGGGPACNQVIVTTDPFSTDVRVNLNRV